MSGEPEADDALALGVHLADALDLEVQSRMWPTRTPVMKGSGGRHLQQYLGALGCRHGHPAPGRRRAQLGQLLFGTAALTLTDWLQIALVSSSIWVADETLRRLRVFGPAKRHGAAAFLNVPQPADASGQHRTAEGPR